jgi:hypothetical protein
MAAITVILATRTTATTLATTAMVGEATIDLGGGIGTTADIMAGGTGTGGVADTAGVAADGTAIINSESRLGCSTSLASSHGIAKVGTIAVSKYRIHDQDLACRAVNS